jgi:hypothetical protein
VGDPHQRDNAARIGAFQLPLYGFEAQMRAVVIQLDLIAAKHGVLGWMISRVDHAQHSSGQSGVWCAVLVLHHLHRLNDLRQGWPPRQPTSTENTLGRQLTRRLPALFAL